MNDFHRSNKVSGVHWLHSPVDKLRIVINLKLLGDIIKLPKFEEYVSEANTEILSSDQSIEEYTFKWQQKVFSRWEIKQYTEIVNCNTDDELKYHEMLQNMDYEPTKVFTYIHNDFYLPLPEVIKKTKTNVLNLNSCMERLNLQETIGRAITGNMESTVSKANLLQSEENLVPDEWSAMHVVFDNSDYDEDSNIIIKREVVLLSVFHNTRHNYLVISPDNNNMDMNPYIIENELGMPLNYKYQVHVGFEDAEGGDELMTLLTKLYNKWEKKHKSLVSFTMPPLDRKKYYVSLEIMNAADFENDNMYIEYTIKIPESIQCEDEVHGRTHVSEALRLDEAEIWNYGHIIELNLEMNVGAEPAPIKMFFEAISTDWWCRHRTEGYGYLALSLQPGHYTKQLSCSRPEEKDKMEADSRRFFIGGCHLIKDLEVLAEPQTVDANFIYKTTGSINLRWNIISQSPIPGTVPVTMHPGTSSASDLLQGAETALKKYRKARARLAAATKDLEVKYEDVGGG